MVVQQRLGILSERLVRTDSPHCNCAAPVGTHIRIRSIRGRDITCLNVKTKEIEMRKFVIAIFALLLVLPLVTACRSAKNTGVAIKEGTEAAADKTTAKMDDASITAAVKMKFAHDETVAAHNIDVDTSQGIVTLTGSVKNQLEADRAVQLARSVDGVKDVRQNLVVQPQ
jgi:osmotically-inducible protein OsmY